MKDTDNLEQTAGEDGFVPDNGAADFAADEFVPVELLPDEPPAEESCLSAEVSEAIRTVVIGTPDFVKAALGVIAAEDAVIVKEILRVIVETAEENVEADSEAEIEDAEPEAAAVEIPEVTGAPGSEESGETADFPEEEITLAVGHLYAPVSRKTYSSSLRRPDMKKRDAASAAKNKITDR